MERRHGQAEPSHAGGEGEAACCFARLFLPAGHRILTADLSPENRRWLAAHHPGMSLQSVSRPVLQDALRRRFGGALLEEAVSGLARRRPDLSARQVISNAQAGWLIWSVLFLGVALALAPLATLRGAIALMSFVFVAGGVFRALLALIGGRRLPPPPPDRLALPRYTILVPLYREAAVLPELAAALAALDYPRDRLQVLLAVEEDDAGTRRAAETFRDFELVVVPPGGPRTKPKAANYALQFARGDYLVVYDAEDRPEPDQLLKAVAAFRAAPRAVACLQARLNFYNRGCWLTNGIMAQTPQTA